ncbi:aminotransferase class I/II-fold pyridoxal phosphate-dependent enzyme [Antribacter sp. KLBMP9083]|uniref:cysteine-S-conjugate beta-lyase n=1 Tax=Antribacter soli TaxID=2910976 RepID=A0AA41QCI3_9MICO|nr:aminotransferase class I/II-fold pyridoxal phosphate-dependent enzyme [Antribacter soli]MCF4120611.1 aminotransferase class I/II-fold pyridoxal phosphate-dependent enzyme [Antribacter soli]
MRTPDSTIPTSPLSDTPLDVLRLDELRRRTSVKWRVFPPDVLPLFVAEMDTPVAPVVADALQHAVASGDLGYDWGTAYGEALASFAERRWSWDVNPARTRTVADVMVGIVEVLRVLTGPGDAVIVTPPVYPPFYGFVRNEGRQVLEAPLRDGRLDPAALEATFERAVNPHGRRGSGSGRRAVLLLCNPHNPTGTAHTRAELEAVLDLAARFGVRVVSDEIHAPVAGPVTAPSSGVWGEFVPILSVPGSETAIALHSASKAYNLAGLRAAVAVAGPGAVADLRRIPEEADHAVNHLAVLVHAAAYGDVSGWLDSVLAGVARNRRLLDELLAQHAPALVHRPGAATYLAWVDASAAVPAGGGEPLGDAPCPHFVREARVAFADGRDFGTGGAGHVRINLATSVEVLTEAVQRVGASLAAD